MKIKYQGCGMCLPDGILQNQFDSQPQVATTVIHGNIFRWRTTKFLENQKMKLKKILILISNIHHVLNVLIIK